MKDLSINKLAQVLTTMVHGQKAVQAINITNTYFDPKLKQIKSWTDRQIEDHFKFGMILFLLKCF